MIETGEVRKLFTGPPEVTATLVHRARVLLGILKNDMAFNSLPFGQRTERVPVNQSLLQYTDSGERKTEVRAEGIAIVTAGSISGQDWIAIDASAVTIITIPQPAGEYIPYLWVGLRTESARGPFTDCTAEDYNSAMLHVFEPVTDAELADIKASPNEELGFNHMASSTRYGNRLFIGIDSNGNFYDSFIKEVLFSELKKPLDVYYSDNNLYQVGHGVASLLSPGYPDTLWQKAVILDPGDLPKTITETGPYEHHNERFGPHAVPSPQEWQLRGRVLGGQYIVKVQMYGQDVWGAADPVTYGGVVGPEQDVILKVIVGKAPGRVEEAEYRIPFDKYQWSAFGRDTDPGGYFAQVPPEPEQYATGPNPHGRSWWQGAFKVDVENGHIQLIKDEETVPEWGFDVTSHETVNLISWHWNNFEKHHFGDFGIVTELQNANTEVRGKIVYSTFNTPGAWPFLGNPTEVTGCESGNTTTVPTTPGVVDIDVTGWTGWQPVPFNNFSALLDGWCPDNGDEPAIVYTASFAEGLRQTFSPEYQIPSPTPTVNLGPLGEDLGLQDCAGGGAPSVQNLRLTCPRS